MAELFYREQGPPENSEVKHPGEGVDYSAEGPTTYSTYPTEDNTAPPGNNAPEYKDEFNPSSAKVIPDQMQETLRDQLTYVQASRVAARFAAQTPLHKLKSYLQKLSAMHQAEEFEALMDLADDAAEVRKLSQLLENSDKYLTGKVNPQGRYYMEEAERVLHADTADLHLADGGYSRLAVTFLTPPFIWLDKGLSTERVVERWTQTRLARGKTAATMADILSQTGPEVHKRSEKIAVNPKRFSPKTGFWTFEATGSSGKMYTVRIKGVRKSKAIKNLSSAQVQCSCSCPFWRWQGPEHWGKMNEFLYGKARGTASFPIIRDPKEKHWACKHLVAALKQARTYRWASAQGWSFEGELVPLPEPSRVAQRFLQAGAVTDFHRVMAQVWTELGDLPLSHRDGLEALWEAWFEGPRPGGSAYSAWAKTGLIPDLSAAAEDLQGGRVLPSEKGVMLNHTILKGNPSQIIPSILRGGLRADPGGAGARSESPNAVFFAAGRGDFGLRSVITVDIPESWEGLDGAVGLDWYNGKLTHRPRAGATVGLAHSVPAKFIVAVNGLPLADYKRKVKKHTPPG